MAVVAFEHHLRADGAGYPSGVRRAPVNLGTQLCAIADAYDAMRSTRVYQPATPAARIMEIMAGNTGQQYDRHLVRRFIHLMGVYPPATLVRLTDDIFSDTDPSWSPDGSAVYFASDRAGAPSAPAGGIAGHDSTQSDLYAVTVATGEIRRPTDWPGCDETSPVAAPDGQRLLFISDRNGVNSIYAARIFNS